MCRPTFRQASVVSCPKPSYPTYITSTHHLTPTPIIISLSWQIPKYHYYTITLLLLFPHCSLVS